MTDGSEPPLMPGPPLRPQGTTLEILGKSHDGDYLMVRINDHEFRLTQPWLDIARRSVARGYPPRPGGHPLDESQITTLINAAKAPQPLWPPVSCRVCDVDASELIDDHPYCRTHAETP